MSDIQELLQQSERALLASIGEPHDLVLLRPRGNRGDDLIHAGARCLLRGRDYREVSLRDVRRVTGHTAVVGGSGGWCRAHSAMTRFLPEVEDRFERVIVFPSSFDVRFPPTRDVLARTSAIVYAREEVSYEQIRDLCEARLALDTAFFFDYESYRTQGEGTLVAYRSDMEAAGYEIPADSNDISISCDTLEDWLWTIARHANVRTDRAHVMIAAAMLGKGVVYRPSNYHKVPAIARYALRSFPVEPDPDPGSVSPLVGKRIALVNWGLGASSSGRILGAIGESWARRGARVSLITVAPVDKDRYQIDKRVRRVGLRPATSVLRFAPTRFVLTRELAIVISLRRALRRLEPDVVIANAVDMNVRTLLVTPRRVVVIVRDHRPTSYNKPGRLVAWLRPRTYRRASWVVTPTKTDAVWLERFVPADRVAIVPPSVAVPEHAPPPRRTQTVLGVGRLMPVKRFDALVEAFAASDARRHGWRLRIVGDGPESGALRAQGDSLGLGREFSLAGWVDDIWSEYAKAGMLVLCSDFESAPKVPLEAMAAGVPVICSDLAVLPGEYISDGIDGLLVPAGDVMALTAAIDRLASDPDLRAIIGERARVAARRYSSESVTAMWDEVLASGLSR